MDQLPKNWQPQRTQNHSELAYLVQQRASGRAERRLLLSHCTGRLTQLSQLEAAQRAAEEAAVVATAFMRQSLHRATAPVAEVLRPQQMESAEG